MVGQGYAVQVTDHYTLCQGDVIDVLSAIKSESVDTIFADPPFNVGKKYGGTARNDRRTDYYEWCDEWISQCFRVLKPTGTFYLMTIVRHLERMYPMMAARGTFISQVNWKNVAANHNKRSYWNSYQPILVYGKTPDYTFNTYAQVREPSQMFQSWSKTRRAKSKGQLLDYWDDIPFIYAGSVKHREAILKPGTRSKAHPCQMPIALPLRAIVFSTNPGDVVLDPFTGSGSTLDACLQSDRYFIGLDREREYIDLITDRANRTLTARLLESEAA